MMTASTSFIINRIVMVIIIFGFDRILIQRRLRPTRDDITYSNNLNTRHGVGQTS